MTCKHDAIKTWRIEDGTPVMWSCVDCSRKFEPLAVPAETAQEPTSEAIHAAWSAGYVEGEKVGMEKQAEPVAAAPALIEALDHIAKTIERQIELIKDRALGDYLDKRPVVRSLQSHAKRARAAIAKSTGEQA